MLRGFVFLPESAATYQCSLKEMIIKCLNDIFFILLFEPYT